MRGPAPTIGSTTRDERLAYVQGRFVCISNCDSCGMCVMFHGKDPQDAFADYVDGKEEFAKVFMRYR